MKILCTLISFLTIQSIAFCQSTDAYELKFKVRGVQDTTVYLANYYGSKLYYKDTAVANSKGEIVFTGKKALPTGKYAVVVPGPKYFELYVQEQRFQMETDTVDFVKHMQVKNSPNNQLFYDYIHFVIEKRKESEVLTKQLAEFGSDSAKSSSITQRMVEMNKEVLAYQNKMVDDNPELIAAKSLKMMIPVNVPEPPVRENGSVDSLFAYNYYLHHFMDHADLDDPNMVRLPEFHQKLDEYMNKVVVQVPDSINRYADLLIDLIERYELYRFDRPEYAKSRDLREAIVKQEIAQSTGSEANPPPTQKRTAMQIHEVKPGETAAQIASRYNISIEILLDRNGLKNTELHVGQLLVVSP